MTVHELPETGPADPITVPARDARAEAQLLVGSGYVARVLEPSSPAVLDGPWFADDALCTGGPAGGS